MQTSAFDDKDIKEVKQSISIKIDNVDVTCKSTATDVCTFTPKAQLTPIIGKIIPSIIESTKT